MAPGDHGINLSSSYSPAIGEHLSMMYIAASSEYRRTLTARIALISLCSWSGTWMYGARAKMGMDEGVLTGSALGLVAVICRGV
jgi:hypothetical protein